MKKGCVKCGIRKPVADMWLTYSAVGFGGWWWKCDQCLDTYNKGFATARGLRAVISLVGYGGLMLSPFIVGGLAILGMILDMCGVFR